MDKSLTNLLNLPGVFVEFCEYGDDSLCFHLKSLSDGINCYKCHNYTDNLHQIRPITVRDLPAFERKVYLNLPRRQFYCKSCQHYITEQLTFIDWRRKYTRRYEESIFYRVNCSSCKQVSKDEGISIEEVKKIFNFVNRKKLNI